MYLLHYTSKISKYKKLDNDNRERIYPKAKRAMARGGILRRVAQAKHIYI